MKPEIRDVVARELAAERIHRGVDAGVFELRETEGGDGLTLVGYACVFEVGYEMYGGPPYGWTEIVDAGAFDKTLREKPDLQLLINHEGMPLARTKSGTLRLAADKTGLHVEADLEGRSTTVAELRLAMERGDIDEMSFAFRAIRSEWNEDYTERRLMEVSIHKGDVSVVNYGANPATSAQIRALAGLAGLEPDQVLAELRSAGHADPKALLAEARASIDRILSAQAPIDVDVVDDGPPADPMTGRSLALARRQLELLDLNG